VIDKHTPSTLKNNKEFFISLQKGIKKIYLPGEYEKEQQLKR